MDLNRCLLDFVRNQKLSRITLTSSLVQKVPLITYVFFVCLYVGFNSYFQAGGKKERSTDSI
ncbi:hypothetical protein ACE1CD_13330 [Aerosakkonema sp. BLCC-F183]|uniref:hypothetical protein n=1 Tax=Aerosakkonema sp. BLCC-F183 TaxID=3342834 RepID=UPI0035BA9940